MTRLGHGELKIARDWIAPAELLGAAARRVRKQIPGIEFALEVPAELPLLWVHPALVEQAVFNILENAARFSPPGGPVSLRAQVDGDRLRIEVADRGPGIPEEERKRIFDTFYSVARGDRGKGGTGLGLSICQGLIGAHGGSVEALPGADGVGTLIVVILPLTAPPDAPG
jgi:two-component system sensor histidine kinase KdpD